MIHIYIYTLEIINRIYLVTLLLFAGVNGDALYAAKILVPRPGDMVHQ